MANPYQDKPQSPEDDQGRDERLQSIHDEFTKKRDKWVGYRARSGIEVLWRKWEKLYDGTYEEDVELNSFVGTLKNGPSSQRQASGRSRVVINIVRPKVDSVVARQAEILLPTDDKNWGIKPTPVPELAEIAADTKSNIVDMQTGQPMTAVAAAIIEDAKKRAELMQDEIDDALTECNYNGECRSLLNAATMRGTGIMKGPFPVVRTSKAWKSGPNGATMEITKAIKPASKEVPCWNVYPDPGCGNDIHRGSGIFEKRPINRRELRALIGLDGYNEAAIRKVLGERPTRLRAAEDGKVSRDPCEDDMYELWEYHGEIGEDNMYSLTEDQAQPSESAFGMLVMVNDTIIGALESWNPDQSVPFDFFVYREREGSPWGTGAPEELEHQQRVVKAAWRALMDNAAAASGYHIVMRKGAVIPQGQRPGEYVLGSRMLWEANDEIDDVSKAFQVFTIDMRAQELLTIVDAAMRFADQESNLPQLLGGEKGTAPETVGGMQILDRNATGPLRFRVKRFDDSITNGQIGRHYDWQMEYSPKTEIKGDFEVDARGASYLLERDIQAQAMLALPAVTNNPRYIPHLDEREELTQILKAMKVDATSMMRPKEVVEQQMEEAAQNPQPDPRTASAEMQLEAKKLEMQDRAEQRIFEHERNKNELTFRAASLDYNRERESKEYEIAMTNAAVGRDETLLKINNDAQLTREQLAAKERLESIKIDNDNARFNAEMAVKVRQGSGI